MTGLTTSHLSDIERGVLTPTLPTLRKISDALERPLEYLLPDDDNVSRSLGLVTHETAIGAPAAARFAELVEAKTNGELRVRMYHHSPFESAWDQVSGLAEGAVDIYVDELLSFEGYARLCGPVCLPYFFRDREHYHRFLQSDLFDQHIGQSLKTNGIRLLKPLANWESGPFEVLLSTDPIFVPGDLVGRKMRSYESETGTALRRALGAEPVVVEWTQVPQAFENGQVDTFLMPVAHLGLLPPHESVKYVTIVDYGYAPNFVIAVNQHEYRKWSPDIQTALVEAAEEAGRYCTQQANAQASTALERLSGEFGLPIIHPNKRVWRNSFEAAIKKVYEAVQLPGQLYKELQSL